jgi:hypothetical protein
MNRMTALVTTSVWMATLLFAQAATAAGANDKLLSVTGGGYMDINDYATSARLANKEFVDAGDGTLTVAEPFTNFTDPRGGGFYIKADGPSLGVVVSPGEEFRSGAHDMQMIWSNKLDTRGELNLRYNIDKVRLFLTGSGHPDAPGGDLEADLWVRVTVNDLSDGAGKALAEDVYRVEAKGSSGPVPETSAFSITRLEGFTGTTKYDIWKSPDPTIPDNVDSMEWISDPIQRDISVIGVDEVEITWALDTWNLGNGFEGVARLEFGDPLELGGVSVSFTENIPSVPVPAAFWLFGSGLLGMIGVARRNKA